MVLLEAKWISGSDAEVSIDIVEVFLKEWVNTTMEERVLIGFERFHDLWLRSRNTVWSIIFCPAGSNTEIGIEVTFFPSVDLRF